MKSPQQKCCGLFHDKKYISLMQGSDIQINFSDGNIFVLNLALALIMFGVSLGLHPSDFKRVLHKPLAVAGGILIQYALLPAITLGICLALNVSMGITFGLILVMVSPGGNMSNFLTKMAKGDVALSVTLTAITTLLAAIATPKLFNFWSSFATSEVSPVAALSMWKMAKIVLLLTALPLAAGMMMTRFSPYWAAKIEPVMKNGSLLIFFAFLVLAFVKNKDNFMDHIGLVFGLVALVNALALAIGFALPMLTGIGKFKSKAIAIEAGIKNSGLSLVLVFNFWDGWGEPALVAAWWGIWHLVAGSLVAWWWGRD
jgi:bile acid:Na+ symporter, BASS family